MKLPRISVTEVSKGDINDAIREYCKEELIEEMKGSSKLKENISEEFEMKPYFQYKNV